MYHQSGAPAAPKIQDQDPSARLNEGARSLGLGTQEKVEAPFAMSERVHVNRFAPLYLRDYERLCRPVRASESNGVKWQTQGCKQNWIGMRVRRLVDAVILLRPWPTSSQLSGQLCSL